MLDCLERTIEAVHYIKKGIELESSNADYLYILGDIQQKLGFYDEAEDSYRKGVEMDPTNIEVWLELSQMLYSQGNIQLAIVTIAESIKYVPDAVELYYQMAGLKYLEGKNQEASEYMEKALGLDFSKHEIIYELSSSLKENTFINTLIEQYRK